jgi:hypothetical protein
MKINDIRELRVGNWVTRKNVPNEFLKVNVIDSIKNTVYLDLNGIGVMEKFDNLESIPISLDIIKKINGITCYDRNPDFPCFTYDNDGFETIFSVEFHLPYNTYEFEFDCCNLILRDVKLHELQNWFYLYTEKELGIEL